MADETRWMRPVVIFLSIFVVIAIIVSAVSLSRDSTFFNETNGTNGSNGRNGETGPAGEPGKNGDNGVDGKNGQTAVYQAQFQTLSFFYPQKNVTPITTPLPLPIGFPLTTYYGNITFPPNTNLPGMIPFHNDNWGVDISCPNSGVYTLSLRYVINTALAYVSAFMYTLSTNTWSSLMPVVLIQAVAGQTVCFGTQQFTATVVSASRFRFIFARSLTSPSAGNVEVTVVKQ
jgi:hypothetical protein